MRPCTCGCEEFITQPNRYDIYRITGGRMELLRSEPVDGELTVYCRNAVSDMEIRTADKRRHIQTG